MPTERRLDGVGERGTRLQELGEPSQGDLEDAAPLTGSDHVDVEPRERAGMMLAERLAE